MELSKSRFCTLNLSKKYPVQTIKWKFYFRVEIRDLINELLENFHSFPLSLSLSINRHQSTRIKLIRASTKSRIGWTIFYLIFTREIDPSFQPVIVVRANSFTREGCSENYAPNEPWHASLSKKFTKLGHPALSNRSHDAKTPPFNFRPTRFLPSIVSRYFHRIF